jgi:hypothetical protein
MEPSHNMHYTVTWRLKAGIVKQEKMSIARQRQGNDGSVTTNSSEYIVTYVAHINTFPWQRVHKQTVTADKKKQLFKVVPYPSRAANTGEDQTKSGFIHSFSQRVRERESSKGLRIEDGLASRCWRIHFVIIICTYDLWVSNKSIHQYKPRLQVTNTRDNTHKCGMSCSRPQYRQASQSGHQNTVSFLLLFL